MYFSVWDGVSSPGFVGISDDLWFSPRLCIFGLTLALDIQPFPGQNWRQACMACSATFAFPITTRLPDLCHSDAISSTGECDIRLLVEVTAYLRSTRRLTRELTAFIVHSSCLCVGMDRVTSRLKLAFRLLFSDRNLVVRILITAQYSFQPPETEYPSLDTVQALIKAGSFPCAERYNHICPVCGCKADKLCSRCKRIKYCSKHHQLMHWKSYHKIDCSSEAPEAQQEPRFDGNDFLLPEFRVCSEPADEPAAVVQDSEDSESDVSSDQGDEEFKELESVAKRETKAEARFRKFKDLMSSEPDQVIRLERGGTPFWLSETPPDIPNCEACGAKRVFEFQVTPQILNYLKLDRLGEACPDFGSLYVFTCSESCPLPRIQLVSAEEVCESASTSVTVEYQSEVVVCQMCNLLHDLSPSPRYDQTSFPTGAPINWQTNSRRRRCGLC
ncbi:programmed cell death protein 2 domain protein [Opisthorchis viverrini]|uniref:Programmed cell death protein 2 domain protein n=1 Tax=Opisthorchis viverrini TaxID=6198 RepID=A0A1S8X8R4_OPIVI|nr:programmed cell death protein 2 domain protein [Opisthorchis viverrini]